MLVPSLPMKSRLARSARDVFGTFTTHSRLLYHVANVDFMDTKVQHSCFGDFQMSSFNKQDEKSNENLMCLYHTFKKGKSGDTVYTSHTHTGRMYMFIM